MNKNYAIHQKHFSGSNVDLKARLKRFHELYPALKDHTALYCYSANDRLPSILVFHPGEDRVDEYESFHLKLVSSYYQAGIKDLENSISFFKGSVFVPTFNRFGLDLTCRFCLTLTQPNGNDQALVFSDDETNRQLINLYDSAQSKKQHFVGHDRLAIYTHLFQHYNFNVVRANWKTDLTFINKGRHIEVTYHQYNEEAAPSELKKDLVFQKQEKDNQQKVSFFLNYDDVLLSRKYVSQGIDVIAAMMTAKDVDSIINHIKQNHYFLQWLIEESSETLSDVSSN